MVTLAQKAFSQCERLRLPEYLIDISFAPPGGREQRERVQVTEAKAFSPFGIETDTALNDLKIDVLLEAGEWRLAIVFSFPDCRPVAPDPAQFSGSKIGIIALTLDQLPAALLSSGELLEGQRHFLFDAPGNKQWLYHPRRQRVEREGLERLERQWNFKRLVPAAEAAPRRADEQPERPMKGAAVSFRCACGIRWNGAYGTSDGCPVCKKPANIFSVVEK